MTSKLSWLLLLHSLPSGSGALRLSLWRQLKRLGAISLKTSASVLPDRPELYETFQWLAQNLRQQGGDATLIRADDIDGITDAELVTLFRETRTADYEELLSQARALLPKGKKAGLPSADEVDKLALRFQAVRQVDYFDCPEATKVEQMLRSLRGGEVSTKSRRLRVEDFQRRVWLTRPRPEVDRVGSAWLIRKFIDLEATFVFSSDAATYPEALPYDMVGVEFGHHGEDCTFETLVRRFALRDAGVSKIAAIIHDADLGDGRHGTQEGAGLLAIFRGWAAIGWSDDEILSRGFDCFDALHRHFSSTKRIRS